MMPFQNRSFVIFGATGGIGAALGHQLARVGSRLTLAARDQLRLDALSGELNAQACSVDATDSGAVDRCLAEAAEKYGRLDGVLNLSPEQAWVTGQVLAVDGGLSSLQSRMASNS